LRADKVGHLGTLDPAVTGVLPLVINKATRFARWIEKGAKEYEGIMTLGVETDTYDAEGQVKAERETTALTDEDIKRAFEPFRGPIKQVPPMYSAVKRSGRPLYTLARKGLVVERPARDVEIFDLEILNISMPKVSFRVSCSRGTYVRSLCHDVGQALGCGAHLGTLRRTSSGLFKLGEAIDPTLDREELEEGIISLDDVLLRVSPDFPALPLEALGAPELAIGTRLKLAACEGFSPSQEEGEMIRFTLKGTDTALAQYVRDDIYKIKWIFGLPCENEGQEAVALN